MSGKQSCSRRNTYGTIAYGKHLFNWKVSGVTRGGCSLSPFTTSREETEMQVCRSGCYEVCREETEMQSWVLRCLSQRGTCG